MMLDANVVACSPSSVYRVLKLADLLAGTSPETSKKGTGFVQPKKPHEHWHIDISYLNISGTFYYLCSILDGYSRSIIHHEIREKMQESDVEILLQRARECHPGVTPRIISDNGPQFVARDFKEFVRIAEMSHVKTSPYYPQSNGKIERWHKTLKGECVRVKVPLSLEEARRVVGEYVVHYNECRLHSAIDYLTPKDKLEGRDRAILAERKRKLSEARERRKQLQPAEKGGECQGGVTECQGGVTERPVIDFAAVRAAVKIASVLQLLGFQARTRKGVQHRGACPLHGSTSGTARCFSVDMEKNLFQCFKCGRKGNALDLWVHATQQVPYDAAVDLCNRLGLDLPTLPPGTEKRNP